MNYIRSVAAAALAAVTHCEQLIDLRIPLQQSVSKTEFGAIVEDLTWQEGSYETTITFPILPFLKDPN
jgi:hypothetical protein